MLQQPLNPKKTPPDSTMETKQLSINELKDAFFSLKTNKSPGYDDISFNVLKIFFSSLCEPLKYLFNLSIEKGFSQMT